MEMNISEKRKKKLENQVCTQRLKEVLTQKVRQRELDMTAETIMEYCSELDLIFRQIGLNPDQKLTLDHALQWKEQHIDRYSRKAMAKKICVLNAYLHYAVGHPKEKPIAQIKNISRSKVPVVLPHERIMDMVQFAEDKGKWTEAIMIYTAFVTASRNGTLHKIKLSDIDLKNNIIILKKCKRDKDLPVPLAESEMQKIKEYIDNHRPGPAQGHEDFLFLNKKGKKVHEERLRKVLEYCASKCDITEKIHPHVMRHSRVMYCRKVLRMEWEEIQCITGWANLKSAIPYMHEESLQVVQKKLDGNQHQNTTPPQNTADNPDREVEILKMRLQLVKQEKENLQMQLQLNHEVSPESLGADQQKGYV